MKYCLNGEFVLQYIIGNFKMRETMKVKIEVFLREDVFDPQGKAILNAVHHLGYNDAKSVQAGKFFLLDIEGDKAAVEKQAKEIADKLLANPVIENFTVTVL